MLRNFVSLLWIGSLFCADVAKVLEHPLILTSIHTLNQEWIHINGLGPWSDQLEMSAPESSETYGSRVFIRLDSQTGTVHLSHCGTAFVGVFRAGDLSVEILHPVQNVFCAKEEALPTEEAFDVQLNVRKNDILFALLPSTAEWTGVKPVDLQGAMYGVEASDSESFHDFVKNLPKVLKDFNCALLVCVVSDMPKGLCEPNKLMYSRSHKGSFLSFDAHSGGFAETRPVAPASSPFLFGALDVDDDEDMPERSNASPISTNRIPLTSNSSSSVSEELRSRSSPFFRFLSSASTSPSSSSEELGGDYNYRSPQFSEDSIEIGEDETYTPEQNQEADHNLLSTSGWFTHDPGSPTGFPGLRRRQRPAPMASAYDDQDPDAPVPFPDLNQPIPLLDLNEPIPTVEPAGRLRHAPVIQNSEIQPIANTRRRGARVMATSRANSVGGSRRTHQPQHDVSAESLFIIETDGGVALPLDTTANHPGIPSGQAAGGLQGRTARETHVKEDTETIQTGRTLVRQRELTDDPNDRDHKRKRR